MSLLLLRESIHFFADLLQWANNQLTVILLYKPLFVGGSVSLFLLLQIPSECSDQVQVGLCDGRIVVLDVCVLLLVLGLEVCDRDVLLVLNLLALDLPLLVHLFPQAGHLVLVLHLDLVRNALVLLSDLSLFGRVGLVESVSVFSVSCLLLLLLDDKGANILLELTFLNAVLIFGILELNLSFFLQLSLLVNILEHQVFQSLLPDLDGD